MSAGAFGLPMAFCIDREPGLVCERCGAAMEGADDYLPSTCIDLEAREDRARELAQNQMAAMERVGGSIVDAITRRRAGS